VNSHYPNGLNALAVISVGRFSAEVARRKTRIVYDAFWRVGSDPTLHFYDWAGQDHTVASTPGTARRMRAVPGVGRSFTSLQHLTSDSQCYYPAPRVAFLT
jgi:hypothetical protein